MGLLEFPKRNDNLSMRVTFLDIDSPEEIFISDFRELGYEYLKYQGENFIRCAECGILTRGSKKNNKKYCKNCSGYIPKVTKSIVCVDCGQEFSTSAYNTKTKRCKECQSIIDREKARIRKQNQRKRDNMSR
jgi:DNA-directed RNA polymerase subunit RPC12/RpoP